MWQMQQKMQQKMQQGGRKCIRKCSNAVENVAMWQNEHLTTSCYKPLLLHFFLLHLDMSCDIEITALH
jgi:hypothetical protein